jgi:hypothetical protein
MVTSISQGTRLFLIAIAAAVLMFGLVTTADAQTCGVTWETPYTIETNPYPPGSPGEAAWAAVYGTSNIVYSTSQVARIDGTGCGEGEMPTSASLIASPTTIIAGQQSSLSWGSYNTARCYGDLFETGGAVSGSVMVSPAETTTYTLTCSVLTPEGEEDTTGARITKQATVTVTPVTVTPVTASLTATPGSVTSGSSATLTWSSTNATSCTGTGFDTAGATSGTVSTGALTTTTNFSVTCTGVGGVGTGATWQYTSSDISDFACPLTDPNRAYSGVPTCVVNPAGKACTGSPSFCKVNTIDGCSINTDIYTCVGGTVTPAPTASASALVSVSALSGVNLTAGGITPTTASVNTGVTLLAPISNTGTAHSDAFRDAAVEAEGRLVGYGRDVSGDGLPVLFQIDSDTDHNSGIAIKTTGILGIAGGGIRNAGVSHTFSTAGTWYVRACADMWGDMTGIVNESNELDNCGPWTAITVTTGGGAVTSCSASPTSITAGGSTTWTALPSGLASYTFTPSETGTGITRATNTYARTYSTAGTYGMSVTAGGATVACSTNVTVGNPSCGTATPTITAVPDRVTAGGTSTITVSATGVDGTCTITGPGVNQTITATSCGIPSTNITTGALTGQSTYTISCDGGETTAKAVVNVATKWSIF